MPLISVIMPVYNGATYLEGTLNDLLNQTFTDFEVICIDDSSTDNSFEIITAYAKKDSRIKVYRKPNERLASLGVKYGLTKAQGLYFMYSSQDDLFSTDLLEQYASKIQEYTPDVIIPNLVCYSGDKNDISTRNFWKETIGKNPHLTAKEAFLLSLDWQLHGFCLFRMSIVQNVGINTFSYNSDEYTTRKLFLSCHKITFCDGIFYYRINNPEAITKKMSFKLYEVFITNRKLEELAIEQNVEYSTIIRLRELALNDVAIRQKFLYSQGKLLSHSEYIKAQQLTQQAYYDIKKKHELYRNDKLRRLFFTHGFWLLKLSMWLRAIKKE